MGLLWDYAPPRTHYACFKQFFSLSYSKRYRKITLFISLVGNILLAFSKMNQLLQGMRSILEWKQPDHKVYIPKCLFPIARSLSSAVNLFFAIIALLVVMLITGSRFHLSLLMIPVVVSYLFMFATGIGMILSSYVIFFRDITHIYGVVIMLWMYVTPIFLP